MCYNKSGKNQMPESSEAKSYTDIKIPLKEKPQLGIVKEEIPEVPQKVQKKIAKKVAACVSAGIVASTGGFVALGETGNLPAQVQEWYDNTSENIRAIFGIEVVEDNVSQNPEAPFEGFEIEGLDHVFQNGRWEYVDPSDSLVAGYWNDKEGRYEHTASILKGEWGGLFVSAVERNEEVKDSIKENEDWTVKRWEEGKIKLLLPFEMKTGVVVEEKKALGIVKEGVLPKVLLISGLTSDTLIYAPFTATSDDIAIRMPSSESSISGLTIGFGNSQPILDIWFKNFDQDIVTENTISEEALIKFGNPLLKIDELDILTRKSLVFINPFIKGEYQILFSAFNSDASGLPVDFSFKNLLKDKEGRFVYLNSAYTTFYGNNE